jgi:hypothetical protein
MDKVIGRVLRSDKVKLEGQVQLKTKQPQSTMPSSQKSVKQPVKAIIIENHPEFAVIEVACCCGERIFLRCEYAGKESQKTED